MERTLAVCLAGATGWTGRALGPAIGDAPDLVLRSAVSRSAAGGDLGEALGGEALGVPVHGSVAEALDGVDVLVEFTDATAVKGNVMVAVQAGVHAVVGTSGLTAADFAEIDAAARERGGGVVAGGDFSLPAALAQAAALLAARHLPQWEILDYASAGKPESRPGPRASSPSASARSAGRRAGIRSRRSTALRRRAARRSPGRRSIRCASRASSSRPRSCSGCRTS